MTTRVYATVADYQTYTGDTLTLAPQLTIWLRAASRHVDRAVIAAVYPTDPQGYPVDANLIVSFKDATCEQVMFLRDTDDDSGVKARLSSVRMGAMSFTRAPGTAGLALKPICPGALEILRNTGVLPVAPMVNW